MTKSKKAKTMPADIEVEVDARSLNPFPWSVEGDEEGAIICDLNGVQFAWFADIEVARHIVECVLQRELSSLLAETASCAFDLYSAVQRFVEDPALQALANSLEATGQMLDAITDGGDES